MHSITTITKPILKAFTLIEILVVIGIAGVIIAVASASYTTAQRQARDSRRLQDIKLFQTAFEQFFTINGYYPTQGAGNIDSAFQSTAPKDPKTQANYSYQTSTSAYCICAQLESTGTGNANAPASTTCTWNTTGNYYCAQNQQ